VDSGIYLEAVWFDQDVAPQARGDGKNRRRVASLVLGGELVNVAEFGKRRRDVTALP
jgi:hypothetical protein